MPDVLLNIDDFLTTLRLVPAPVQVLSHSAELNDEIARKVFWLSFAALLTPELQEGRLVDPMIISGVEAAYK